MKNINILRALEANKENRQFQLVPNRQNRIQSTINFKEELIPKPKQNIIRLTKFNKSSRLRVRGLEDKETRQVSYEAPKPKPELFQHYQRTLKNRSLTNIQVTMPSQSVPCSVPQSANSKKLSKIQHEKLQKVIPYSNEIIDHLVKSSRQQYRNQFKGLFLQAQITEKMRNTLLNWILEVHYKLKLQPETLFLAISIIDRFIEKEQVQQCKFQLLGISSLFIAGKYQEVYGVPKSSHLAQFCDEAFTREDILRMEGQILLTLNFDLGTVSALQIVEHLGQDDPLIRLIFD